jgi:hypothetical protein
MMSGKLIWNMFLSLRDSVATGQHSQNEKCGTTPKSKKIKLGGKRNE